MGNGRDGRAKRGKDELRTGRGRGREREHGITFAMNET